MTLRTLSHPVSLSGRGVHSDVSSVVTIRPGTIGSGIQIQNPAGDFAPLTPERAHSNGSCTVANDVKTVEHMLAAVHALGLTDLEISVKGEEVPILDGTGLPFYRSLKLGQPRAARWVAPIQLHDPLIIEDGERWIRAQPAKRLELSVTLDMDHVAIGRQSVTSLDPAADFAQVIGPARTFGLVTDFPFLLSLGLAQGSRVNNTLVFGRTAAWNRRPSNQFEPAWHKMLDLYGDLALMGQPLAMAISAYQPGHDLNVRFVKALQEALRSGLASQVRF